jgi:hypothetical protein
MINEGKLDFCVFFDGSYKYDNTSELFVLDYIKSNI